MEEEQRKELIHREDLDVGNPKLPEVMRSMSDGQFRIPQFQREYVWDRSDVVDLFDSLYQYYPIGSFFLWDAPKTKSGFFRQIGLDQPDLEESDENLKFVLDGQQRLTSLYVTLYGMTFGEDEGDEVDYSKITFDLEKENFKVTPKANADHLVKVCDIWGDKSFRQVVKDVPEKYENLVWNCRERLREYPVSVIEVESENIDEVIEIFERINQKGTRLGRFDIVNANIWSEDFDLRRKIDEELVEELEDYGFGAIDRGTVTQTLALVLSQNCSTDTQKDLDTENVKEIWPEVRDCLVSAVHYLEGNLGVKQASFIPYEGMIPVLAYYIYESGNNGVDPQHQEKIDRWFWQTSFSERYGSSTQTEMTNDAEKFKEMIEGEEIEINFPPNVNKKKLINTNIKKSTSGLRNAFLCILAESRPQHFEDGKDLKLTTNYFSEFKIDHHHIFPNSYLKSQNYSTMKRKSVMDITFIPKNLNRHTIRDTNPKEYFTDLRESLEPEEFENRMESHMIPYGEDSGIWDNDYEKFLDQRADLFLKEIKRLIGDVSGLEANIEDKPKQVVEEAENIIRDRIDEVMKDNYGEYWNHVPPDIQGDVKHTIQKERKKNPDLEINGDRERLDYCNIMDYSKIICSNFDLFDDIFPSKADVESRFKEFADYRNSLMHSREADEFTKSYGELAMQWILSNIQSNS